MMYYEWLGITPILHNSDGVAYPRFLIFHKYLFTVTHGGLDIKLTVQSLIIPVKERVYFL